MIVKDLKTALGKGTKIRLLTGNYLGITQPSALYLIKKELGEQVELRFYNDKERSFHPKAYMFHYENYSEIYIGSSNISRSAFTSGIEWNYRFTSVTDKTSFHLGTFTDHHRCASRTQLRQDCSRGRGKKLGIPIWSFSVPP